jgi:hypothetical protein
MNQDMLITKANIDDVYKSTKSSIETLELKGYELVENLFVDNSGFGSDDEPALTRSSFESRLIELLNQHGPLYAFITDVGQFQVYIGLFKKTGKPRAVKIANNTYRVDLGTKEAIRLHDTNILVFDADHVTLNSGGWLSQTTKDRMNQYLPYQVRIIQKNFNWFVQDGRDNTCKPFKDGMTIAA